MFTALGLSESPSSAAKCHHATGFAPGPKQYSYLPACLSHTSWLAEGTDTKPNRLDLFQSRASRLNLYVYCAYLPELACSHS